MSNLRLWDKSGEVVHGAFDWTRETWCGIAYWLASSTRHPRPALVVLDAFEGSPTADLVDCMACIASEEKR